MAGCGCDNNSCGVDYSTLPILSGCPGDDETLLVGNAEGGVGAGKYARRKWSDIKSCIGSSGGGYKVLSDTIASNSTSYQHNDLIGATEVAFVILNKQLFTYEDGDFAFNDNTGTIAFLTISLFTGDKLISPYKPV